MKFIQLFFIQCVLFLTLLSRLVYLQYIDSGHFKKLSYRNHLHIRLIPNERGIIKDKDGIILAENKPTYKGYIFSYDKDDFFKTLLKLQKILPFDVTPSYQKRSYILIYPTLTWEQIALLESANITSLKIEETYKRHYTFGEMFFPILGYVSLSRETDELTFSGLYLGRGIG